MPAPIIVNFQIGGAAELARAFDTIEKRAKKLANVEERAAKQGANAAKSAARTQIAASKNLEKIKERSALMTGRWAARAAAQEIRAAEKSSRAKVRIAEQEARAVARAKAREARAIAKADAASRMGRTRMASGAMGAVGRGVRGTVGSLTGMATGMGLTAGGIAITSALMAQVKLTEQAAYLVNSTRDKTGAATQTTGGLTSFAQSMGSKYGVSADETLTGLGVVAERAGGGVGLTRAMKDWEDLTKTAVAYGVSMEDLGAVVAASINAGIQPGKEMTDLIEGLVAMGKEGQIEFRNLGPELPRLMGAAKATEMGGSSGVREMVALAQLAVDATVSAEEARTAVARSIDDMGMKAPQLRKAGVEVFGKSGRVRATHDLIPDILAAAEKDPSKFGSDVKSPTEALMKIFGVRSKKMTNSLANTFSEAGGGEAGKKAVKDLILGKAGAKLGGGERDAALATVMGTDAKKFQQNYAQFQAEIGKMLPAFTKLLPQILSLTQGFAKLAVVVADNPLKSLGALLAFNVGKEVATAALPSLFKSAFASMQTATYGGTGGLGKLGGAGSALAITAAAVTITAMGVELIDQASDRGKVVGKGVFAADVASSNIMNRGGKSAKDLADLEAQRVKLAAYADRSKFGAVGQVASGEDFAADATALVNPLTVVPAVAKMAYDFFKASSEQSQGTTSDAAAEKAAQIAAYLAASEKSAAAIATNMAKGADASGRNGKPATALPGD